MALGGNGQRKRTKMMQIRSTNLSTLMQPWVSQHIQRLEDLQSRPTKLSGQTWLVGQIGGMLSVCEEALVY